MGIKKNIMKKIKRALISVSNKKNLKPLLRILKKFKIKIISSGGTYKKIKNLGFDCTEVSKFTGISRNFRRKSKNTSSKNSCWYFI